MAFLLLFGNEMLLTSLFLSSILTIQVKQKLILIPTGWSIELQFPGDIINRETHQAFADPFGDIGELGLNELFVYIE